LIHLSTHHTKAKILVCSETKQTDNNHKAGFMQYCVVTRTKEKWFNRSNLNNSLNCNTAICIRSGSITSMAQLPINSQSINIPVMTPTAPGDPAETFVLAPPDFDWQNILVDDDGTVVGLIDWDGVSTCARYQGWAASPNWLSDDYSMMYEWNGKPGSEPQDFERYRKMYAQYMAEAMDGQGDCKYTAKSHPFDVVVLALNCRYMTEELLEKILSAVMPRMMYRSYLANIGGCRDLRPGEEERLRHNMRELFACKPGPDERFSF